MEYILCDVLDSLFQLRNSRSIKLDRVKFEIKSSSNFLNLNQLLAEKLAIKSEPIFKLFLQRISTLLYL